MRRAPGRGGDLRDGGRRAGRGEHGDADRAGRRAHPGRHRRWAPGRGRGGERRGKGVGRRRSWAPHAGSRELSWPPHAGLGLLVPPGGCGVRGWDGSWVSLRGVSPLGVGAALAWSRCVGWASHAVRGVSGEYPCSGWVSAGGAGRVPLGSARLASSHACLPAWHGQPMASPAWAALLSEFYGADPRWGGGEAVTARSCVGVRAHAAAAPFSHAWTLPTRGRVGESDYLVSCLRARG